MKLRKLNPLRLISFQWWTVIIFYFVVLMIGGCAEYSPCPSSRYRPGDPCILAGERFEQIPNFEYSAVKRKERGEVW